jgi:hypothetical protein
MDLKLREDLNSMKNLMMRLRKLVKGVEIFKNQSLKILA